MRFLNKIYLAVGFRKKTVADTDERSFFTRALLVWHAGNARPLPWKGERDPYKIWLSEVILQQTRVEQGLPYYQRFVEAYPTVQALAAAPEDEVFKRWEGLGYYARARNMLVAARFIARERNGRFPDTYDGIRALKGVGDYTAAAIASFAYGLPHAVLDGNVYRVLARCFGIETPIDTSAAKKEFSALARALLDPARPGAFNQAMMDFGATHCTPQQPACSTCLFAAHCVAFQNGAVAALPRKSKSLVRKERFFAYAVLYHRGHLWVRQRQNKDIWRGLYEFPLLELPQPPADAAELPALLLDHFFPGAAQPGIRLRNISRPYRQTLSHQVVTAFFCEFDLPEAFEPVDQQAVFLQNCLRVDQFTFKKILAFPRLIDWFWQEKDVTLRLI